MSVAKLCLEAVTCQFTDYVHPTFSKFISKTNTSTALKLNISIKIFIMSTPLGGGYIIFSFSAVRCPASRMVSAHLKEKY